MAWDNRFDQQAALLPYGTINRPLIKAKAERLWGPWRITMRPECSELLAHQALGLARK